MEKLSALKENWKVLVGILFAFGIVSTNDVRLATISIMAMLLVAIFNAFVRTWKVRLGANWLSVCLYFVAILLAIAFDPGILKDFPAYTGDVSSFVIAIAKFLSGISPIIGVLMASATVIYNSLRPLVFDKLLESMDVNYPIEKIG